MSAARLPGATTVRSDRQRKDGPVSEHPLDPIFHPRSVAVVGVSSQKPGPGARDRNGFLNSLMALGFHEHAPLYPVNPKIEEIDGLHCYPSIEAIPGPVDHVISSIPAAGVPELVRQCVAKGVHSLHLYTAGFAETGEADVAQVEAEIVARARAGGVRVIGPNCMGLYVPESRLSFMEGFPAEQGHVMFISQSGANAMDVVAGLGDRGVRFSKVVSFGNGSDLDAADFFEYAASDPDTSVVIAYIEGVRRGRAFFEAVRACAAVKPTVILKGGITGAGARAANSHTGSLAGSIDIFEALCRQTGALRAETMDDLQDMVIALSTSARTVQGRGVVLMGGGGGFSVLSADAIAMAGLDLPPLPAGAVDELQQLVPRAGTSVRNPIDAGFWGPNGQDDRKHAMEIIGAIDTVDTVFVSSISVPRAQRAQSDAATAWDEPEYRSRSLAAMIEVQQETGTPFISIRGRRMSELAHSKYQLEAYVQGVAVFPTVPRAARAVANVLRWRAQRQGLPALF